MREPVDGHSALFRVSHALDDNLAVGEDLHLQLSSAWLRLLEKGGHTVEGAFFGIHFVSSRLVPGRKFAG